MPAGVVVNGDRGRDGNAVRRAINDRGAPPNIPPKANRRFKLRSAACSIAAAT